MKLTSSLLRSLQVGESVIITDSYGGEVRGQGDISCATSRLKPKRFQTKMMLLIDPKDETCTRVVRITRVEDQP
jgi:hypothetical protein